MAKTRKYQKSVFAQNVIKARKIRKMNGMEFAEYAGIPYSTLADIEAGMSGGRQSTKEKIARALNTTVDELNTPTQEAVSVKSDLLLDLISKLPALDEGELQRTLRDVNRLIDGRPIANPTQSLAPKLKGKG